MGTEVNMFLLYKYPIWQDKGLAICRVLYVQKQKYYGCNQTYCEQGCRMPIFVEHWVDNLQFYPNFALFLTLGG